jgi:predicted branched-subunit amino acid permease
MSITLVDPLMDVWHNVNALSRGLIINERGSEGVSMRSEGERGSGGYLAGARAVLPLALATGVMGISFGVLAYALGWGVVAPIVFSVITFSGTAQFAVASVLGGGGGVVPAIVSAVLLNARFLPMGVAIAPSLNGVLCAGRWRVRR